MHDTGIQVLGGGGGGGGTVSNSLDYTELTGWILNGYNKNLKYIRPSFLPKCTPVAMTPSMGPEA